jgi:hypothetical protein
MAIAACTEAKSPTSNVAARTATPVCPKGAFATELEKMLPSLDRRAVALIAPTSIDKKIEPGCVVPFRREPDDRLIDVGRVVVRTLARGGTGKARLIGRGRLEIGRRTMRLRAHNEAGDEALAITLDGNHVKLFEKGRAPFEGDISLNDDNTLPLPLDALVAALDDCGADERLGKTEDGNVIEAKRGTLPLWRSRWMDPGQTAIVDTSVVCTASDARLLWRTAVGEVLPMIALASSRSDRALVIVRQGASDTNDITDYGFDGMR